MWQTLILSVCHLQEDQSDLLTQSESERERKQEPRMTVRDASLFI